MIFETHPREEDDEFDKVNHRHLNQYMANKNEQLKPRDELDMEAIRWQFTLATKEQLEKPIKELKQRAPGGDEITKYQLQAPPENMKTNFCVLINTAISLGFSRGCGSQQLGS